MMETMITFYNAQAVALAAVPELSWTAFSQGIEAAVRRVLRLVGLFARPDAVSGFRLFAVLADDAHGTLQACGTRLEHETYPSLTPGCTQAHLFERELAEQWHLIPQGHPWLKPVRFSSPWRPDARAERPSVGRMAYFQMTGQEVHEVAVGPVHAGIIEPGHFRFQCHGETVHHLEISLGYQHRGIERALTGGPDRRTRHLIQTAAGDTTVGHSLAYAQIIEALGGTRIVPTAQALRGIALELERLANHVGDLGALAGDVGYLPTQSFCGRLRGEILNLTALICGSRFGREWIKPGGVFYTLDQARADRLRVCLDRVMTSITAAVNLLWSTPSVMARFEGTGIVTRALAEELGLVGVAARATGLARDARTSHPVGIYALHHIPEAMAQGGDVLGRALVRWIEIQRSARFVREILPVATGQAPPAQPGELRPGSLAVSLVEAWRGEICHVAVTDARGRLAAYKMWDPSFHNWMGLALALRRASISDFPLCNKSMNLSYCGCDL